MSIKKPQLYFLIFVLVGYALYSLIKPARPIPRSFTSEINVSQYTSRGIVDRIIGLKIKTKSVRNIGSNLTEVIAFVSMPFDFEGALQYKWTLGQNVQLVEGSLDGTTSPNFRREASKEIKIIVSGYDPKELRHIGFEVWGDKNGRRLYADGLISSQKENSFEDIVQHVEKMKAEKQGIHK